MMELVKPIVCAQPSTNTVRVEIWLSNAQELTKTADKDALQKKLGQEIQSALGPQAKLEEEPYMKGPSVRGSANYVFGVRARLDDAGEITAEYLIKAQQALTAKLEKGFTIGAPR